MTSVMRVGRLKPSVVGILALAATISGASFVGARDQDGPDIKVATVTAGRCERPADSLPILVTTAGAEAGDVVGDVSVCVNNRGEPAWALLSMRAIELVDVDTSCTGGEASVDATCGGGAQGELSGSLVQLVGVAACPSVPESQLSVRGDLSDLAERPLLLALMRHNQDLCVRLQLRYVPVDAVAAEVSQSDSTTWRYAFSLTGAGDD